MSKRVEATIDTAKDLLGSARDTGEHAVTRGRSALFDTVKAVVGVVGLLRGLGVTDMLGWVGLARRRTPLMTLALFGAGAAVGVGAAMVLTPVSGPKLRREVAKWIGDLPEEAKALVARGVEEIKEAEEKVEGLAFKAGDVAKEAAKKAERKLTDDRFASDDAESANGKQAGMMGMARPQAAKV